MTQRERVTKSQNSAGGLVTRRDLAWAETGETLVRGKWPVKTQSDSIEKEMRVSQVEEIIKLTWL